MSSEVCSVSEKNSPLVPEGEPQLDLAIYGMSWVNVGMTSLGLAGNALAYATASHLRQQTSVTGLMKFLAVTDSLAITTTAVQSSTFGLFQWSNNDYACITMSFFGLWFRTSGEHKIQHKIVFKHVN